jgi:predicted O-methyltransferase YrrM
MLSMIKSSVKNFIDRLPYIRNIVRERDLYKTDYPPGHYHSSIVSTSEIKKREQQIFSTARKDLDGIDLNEEEQLALLRTLSAGYPSIPFTGSKQEKLRYYYDNGFYCQSDGIFLHLMMRQFKPRKIIEVGSGFSSAAMLDTNELFLDNSVALTFIEPYPDRLYSQFKPADREKHRTIVSNLQDVDLALFEQLEENDMLFIDSTHVAKTDSDVNTVLFNILPRLKKGVLIHFHDIFYPFEYPRDWVLNWNGFGWNEDYILRAFLMYNDCYRIIMFNTFLETFHKDWFRQHMPDCLKNEGGSIWLQKM